MDRNSRRGTPVIGGSSLLVIFAVLCLTVFALFGLSAVQAGGRLSQASARAVADYYRADCRAEELFARLRAGELPEGVSCEISPSSSSPQEAFYSYTCPISETQQLCVELHYADAAWTVLRWQTQSTADWQADDNIHVWDGT